MRLQPVWLKYPALHHGPSFLTHKLTAKFSSVNKHQRKESSSHFPSTVTVLSYVGQQLFDSGNSKPTPCWGDQQHLARLFILRSTNEAFPLPYIINPPLFFLTRGNPCTTGYKSSPEEALAVSQSPPYLSLLADFTVIFWDLALLFFWMSIPKLGILLCMHDQVLKAEVKFIFHGLTWTEKSLKHRD